MKKVLIVLFVFLAAGSASLYGQKWIFGVKAGMSSSNLQAVDAAFAQNDGDEMRSRLGFHAGFLVQREFSGIVGLRSELVYSQEGFRVNGGQTYLVMKANYINIPLLATVTPVDWFSIYAGPAASMLVDSKVFDEGYGDNEDLKYKVYDVKPVKWSLAMGVTILPTDWLEVYFRYDMALSNFFSEKDPVDVYRNHNIQIGIGYRF